ncbi:mersacidin/lichenicidin family type 2 lantibiotic [Catellatospora sp. NPDC049609]|uniref:mersacidin/lichenicidin family type 2 lantibiotic n=1 Tax=Catellatospora sp. NPDC049609 TaxID=3155505 RepID=UPI00343A3247
MSISDVVRNWTDEFHRASTAELPGAAHPAGLVEMSRDELQTVAGGAAIDGHTSACCHCVC